MEGKAIVFSRLWLWILVGSSFLIRALFLLRRREESGFYSMMRENRTKCDHYEDQIVQGFY